MSQQPRLRPAQPSDLGAIVAIYNSSIPSGQSTADTVPVTVASRATWFAAHEPTTYPLWVLELDCALLGWLGFQPFYGRPAYRFTAELSLYVAPEYQGQGWGKYLLRHALVASPELGLQTLLAFIFACNQRSLNLFQNQGFERWGYLPGAAQFPDHREDLVILGKQVSEREE
ncbi:MAG: GNAT family N-acetyltransferase [Cyanobacteriota bacterium]|nr:GNAT family N-acetyltransferase [Cyanobacteriota bacterium]